ncbi:endoplasmic reticulum membrane sensor NFE2L1-like isoform X2 [Eriocheir sinensis]|uniref:endoplasmic reticulum membrane sensor NFE2L1-like isoform X2 n=1 Tax=Eriocheir sinensis TaxID=95602 RepID=UPI0021C6C284|nr:endoplasmic reticulum membrane sensor NFE2L1-like isoform X2 [Eriocheir sinensis]
MLLYARKKSLRDERVLQLVLLLSLLRGDPDSLLGSLSGAPLADLPHDLILGSSLGHARPSSPMLIGADLHPKSMDRVLADYQRSVLEDLNALGRYSWPPQPSPVLTYLLNSHTSFPSPPSADTPDHHQPAADPATQPSHRLPDTPQDYSLTDDLTPEDLALIEALWKQDVDLGVPREVYEDDGMDTTTDTPSKDKDHGKKPKGDTTVDEKPEDNLWMHLNYTVDSETGEQLLSPENHISGGDVTLDSVSPLNSPAFTLNETVPDFNLDFNLDEALKFVGLNCSETGETVWKPAESESSPSAKGTPDKEKEDSEDGIDSLNDTLDDMIQASQLHPQHPRSLQVGLECFVVVMIQFV